MVASLVMGRSVVRRYAMHDTRGLAELGRQSKGDGAVDRDAEQREKDQRDGRAGGFLELQVFHVRVLPGVPRALA